MVKVTPAPTRTISRWELRHNLEQVNVLSDTAQMNENAASIAVWTATRRASEWSRICRPWG
jgi:valyl-tRNA synthetase